MVHWRGKLKGGVEGTIPMWFIKKSSMIAFCGHASTARSSIIYCFAAVTQLFGPKIMRIQLWSLNLFEKTIPMWWYIALLQSHNYLVAATKMKNNPLIGFEVDPIKSNVQLMNIKVCTPTPWLTRLLVLGKSCVNQKSRNTK